MRISMFMLAALAAIAFAVPMANAREVTTEHSFFPHKVVKHTRTTKAKTATGTKTATAPRPPLYIYIPGFTGSPTVASSTDSCATSMIDCSDDQLCESWGLNCSTAGGNEPVQAQIPAPATASNEIVTTG